MTRRPFLPAFLILLCSASCTETVPEATPSSCDFPICDTRRLAIDTLTEAYGVLHHGSGDYYIEATAVWNPHIFFISCMAAQVELPDTGRYVRFSGLVKDPCSTEEPGQIDSLYLQEIEALTPVARPGCPEIIVGEEFDLGENDTKLHILHLRILDDCLRVLVSYTGNCNGLPNLQLVSGGDILFGGQQMTANLQGEIGGDCDVLHYAQYTYDLSPLRDLLSGDSVILRFQNQGDLRVAYQWED